MELTFVTDMGHTFTVEIDPNMELENVMALLEAEVSTKHNDPGTHLNTVHPVSLAFPSRQYLSGNSRSHTKVAN